MVARMGEIRCPMCGKPNPDDLDVCQYCEARLKPLIGPFEPADTHEPEERERSSVTDWLDSLREQEQGELFDAEAEFPEGDESAEDVSLQPEESYPGEPAEGDWLSKLLPERGSGEEAEASSASESPEWSAEEASQETSVPDWLSDLGKSIQEQEEEETFSEAEIEAFQDVDLWGMGELGEEEELGAEQDLEIGITSQEEIEPAEQLPKSGEEIPDWLQSFVESEPTTSAEPEEAAESEPGVAPDWLVELEETAGIDTSSDDLEVESELEKIDWEALQTDQIDLKAGQETPTTLEDVPAVAPFALDEEEASLDIGEMPEWLAEADADDSEEQETPLEEIDASLTPGELPGWLEAMRPVEAAAPTAPFTEESDQEVESRGPLAGLRGVLPIEPEITQIKKPAAYAMKLQISDSERKHASLFEELISNEGVSAPIEKGFGISSQNVLRVVIFLLLLFAVGWPIYTGSQSVDLPLPSRETNQASRMIDNVMVSEPVLLAVDYEPGFSGEMDAASASIVDHLMIRGAYLAVVSSTPTGPAQAERLIKIVNNTAGHAYQYASQYSNFGYVPGGPAGLLSFAQAPRRVIRYGLDGEQVWEAAILADVQTLADFAFVIVITDRPETARVWIEQVQPTLGDTNMILVVSAQAEPLVRPYYEGVPQQVNGMVIGLAGAAAYENGMPRTLLARKYWDAYSYGLTLAALFILAGSTFNSLSRVFAKRKNTFKDQK